MSEGRSTLTTKQSSHASSSTAIVPCRLESSPSLAASIALSISAFPCLPLQYMIERRKRSRLSFTSQLIFGLSLGTAWGLFLGDHGEWVKWIGDAFVGLLQMTVLPYVTLTLVANVGRLSNQQGSRMARVSLAVIITLWLIGLGTLAVMTFSYPEWKSGSFFSTSLVQQPEYPNWLELFIPSNPFWSLANNLVPAVVIFSLGLGVALISVENKEPLLNKLDILIEGLARLNKMVVRLSPLGIFGIVGYTASSMSWQQFGLLQGYLLVYGVAALVLSLWLIPALLASCTPFSHRELLKASRDMLLTAFIVGNTFVVLPMIIEAVKRLKSSHEPDRADDEDHMPEYFVPLAYPFPDLGRILGMIFIPFAAWFYGTQIEPTSYLKLVGVGFVGAFAKPIVTIPLLLSLAEIPDDIFHLYLAAGVVASRFGDLMKAIHLFAFAVLTSCILSGALRFNLRRIMMRSLMGISVLIVSVIVVRSVLVRSFQFSYDRENLVVARELKGSPAEFTVLDEAIPNPDAMEKGEDLMDRILRRQKIRIGFDPDGLPFSYFNREGKLVGFDIDMAHQLAHDLEVAIEFIPFTEGVIEHLENDHFDVAMAGMEGTLKRSASLPHVNPYMDLTIALVVPDHRRHEFRSLKDFDRTQQLRVALIAGSVASEHSPHSHAISNVLGSWSAIQSQDSQSSVEFVNVKSESEFFDSYPRPADILVTSAEAGSAWTLKHPEYAVVKPTELDVRVPLYYLVAEESRFEEFLEGWLALKERNGTKQQLYDYWILGRAAEESPPRWCVIRDVLDWVE